MHIFRIDQSVTKRNYFKMLTKGTYGNMRSRQAKLHHGRGLFCTRKPSKTGCENNINTHCQHSQVKLLREQMFTDEDMAETSLIISMDDKATLKPGTDMNGNSKAEDYNTIKL